LPAVELLRKLTTGTADFIQPEAGVAAPEAAGEQGMRYGLVLIMALFAILSAAFAEPTLSVERLLKEGWEIAGYTGTLDNRSSLILFRHKDKSYLVQCSVFFDVTRTPRTNTNCYEVH
jgi:hypothetical protein